MAEEVEEEPKKSNLLKIIIFVVGGILLIAVGLQVSGKMVPGRLPAAPADKAFLCISLALFLRAY